jgi:hypothetical protein
VSFLKLGAGQWGIHGIDVTGVYVSDIGFLGADGNDAAIGISGASSKVVIRRCETTKACLYSQGSTAATYALTNDTNSVSNVIIEDCVGRGNAASVVGPHLSISFLEATSGLAGVAQPIILAAFSAGVVTCSPKVPSI